MIINFTPNDSFEKDSSKLFLFNIFPKLSFSNIDQKITYKNITKEKDLLLLAVTIFYLLDLKELYPMYDIPENTNRDITLASYLETGSPLRLFQKKEKGLQKFNILKNKQLQKEIKEKKDEAHSLTISFRKLNNLLLTANSQYYFSNGEFLFKNTMIRDYANFPEMISTDLNVEDGKQVYNYNEQEYTTPVIRYQDLIMNLNSEWYYLLRNLDEEALILLSLFDKEDVFFKLLESTYNSTKHYKEFEFQGVEMLTGVVYTLLGSPLVKNDGKLNISKSKVTKMFKKVVIKTNEEIGDKKIHVVNNHQYQLYLDKIKENVEL